MEEKNKLINPSVSLEEMMEQNKLEEEEMDSWRYILFKSPTIPMVFALFGVFLMVMSFFNSYGAEITASIISVNEKIIDNLVFMDYVFLLGFVVTMVSILANRLIKWND